MTIDASSGLRHLFRQLRSTIAPPALILLYHRVAEVNSDPWSLSVSPQHFADHLDVVRKRGYPVALKQLNRTLQDGKRLPRSIAITFDDGYANNLYRAKPLLERYDIPATVFVTSGYIGKTQEFWWDELEQVLLKPGRLPETLPLHINGSLNKWMLGAAVDYSEVDYGRDYDRYAPNAEPGSRLFFYYSVWQRLQPLPDEQRREVLDQIWAWANVRPKARLTHRPLDSQELRTLEKGGLVEVGAHTVTHPLLAGHPIEIQREEILQSKGELEDMLGHPVTSFSYPHGNYTRETLALVREAGFSCACTCAVDTVRRNTDCFQLPRIEVRDWDGEEFARRLLMRFDR
jgi:peptidoglycan/xylan/chitin deacetylase (PgdA/CDA1 family)